jgi:hypothetical protein
MKLTYDRRAAAKYALKYATNYNPEWPSYKGGGGDCTNFVSQALYAGGWTMLKHEEVSSPRHSVQSWYSDRFRYGGEHTNTWSNARDFNSFLANNVVTRVRRCGPDELALGDVVQLNDYGIIHHTVIVTGVLPTTVRGKNVAFVTYHTNDVVQTILATIQNKKGDNIICWKIIDVFESPEEDWDSGGPAMYVPR